MNRIDQIFSQLRSAGGKALMPYLTAGDPDIATTGTLLPRIESAGASICELGIPFSDPIADGPVIEASMTVALDGGVRLADIFQMVREQRDKLALGLIAMVSYSIVHKVGEHAFVRDAKAAGFDGFIFPDMPIEAGRWTDLVAHAGDQEMICSMLIAPTTPIDRARRIASSSTGFVYLLSRAGITGERSELPTDLPQRINRLRDVTDLPIAVGFGIANRGHVAQVVNVADAAIVGSAIMRGVATHRDAPREELVDDVAAFVRDLAQGLGGG
jgi:tryptophan synthase alpha chain